jgi:hypothetical protein
LFAADGGVMFLKKCYPPPGLCGVTTQKTATLISHLHTELFLKFITTTVNHLCYLFHYHFKPTFTICLQHHFYTIPQSPDFPFNHSYCPLHNLQKNTYTEHV